MTARYRPSQPPARQGLTRPSAVRKQRASLTRGTLLALGKPTTSAGTRPAAISARRHRGSLRPRSRQPRVEGCFHPPCDRIRASPGKVTLTFADLTAQLAAHTAVYYREFKHDDAMLDGISYRVG